MKTVASHKLSALLWILILQFCVQTPAFSQSVLNYQGRVISGGTAFNGTGQFKFAIVSSDGSTVYWKNDGATTADAPSTAISLPVIKGLFSVQLGDVSVGNMGAIASTVLANTGLKLRIWFNDGLRGFQQFSPDVKLATAPSSQSTDRVVNMDFPSQYYIQSLMPKFAEYPIYVSHSIDIVCAAEFAVELYVDGSLFASGSWGGSSANTMTDVKYPCIKVIAGTTVSRSPTAGTDLKACVLFLSEFQDLRYSSAESLLGKRLKWRVYNSWGELNSKEHLFN